MKSQLQLLQEAMADKTIQQQRLMFAQGFHSPKTALAKNTGFTDQVGAFFRQTNTVYNLAIAMNEPIFPPERGYNPAEDPDVMANPWIREKYPEAFTSLMKAESRVEANYLVNKIREENRDREVIQEGGLASNIFAGLGAGVVDPVNWIAFSGATRAAKALNVAARPMTIAGIGAAENVLGLTVAEPFLRIAQETRTDEEFHRDLVGGAIFGAIIGGMSGGISSSRTAASRALLGADTVEDALDPASYSAWLQRNPVEQQRLDELIEGDEGFAIFGQDREEVAGILLKATSEINPGLAKVLGISQGILGKLLAKLLFLNPEMNLARSESQFARGALDIMLKPAIVRTDTLNRQSVEAVMGIAEIAGLRIRHDMNLVFAEYRSAGGRLSNAEVMVLGAKAAVRGDIVDPANASHELSVSTTTGELELANPFESIIGDSQTIKAVEEVAKINRKFFDTLRKTGESAGAFTGEDFINSIELENYLTRVYKKEKIMVYLPQFKKSIFLALEDKKARELPEMEVERQKLVDEHEALSAPDPVAPPTRTPLPLEEPPSLATPDPSSINETTWYHGSAVEIERPTQDLSRTDSLFGIGFYMTDAPSVARGYGPVSHRVKVDVRKTLDFDEDLPDDAFDLIVSNARVLLGDDNWVPSSRKGSEVWDDMVTELYQMTISVDEAAETFQVIADELRHVLGYDAITHIGGGRAGGGRAASHRVVILLDPEGDRWGAVATDSISHRSVLSIDTEPPPPTTPSPPTPRSPEELAEIVWDRARLEREIAEYDEWIAKLGDEDRWEEIANQVYENITNDTGTGPLGGGAGNSLKQRVLTVEDRFIAPWLEDDVMNIQANQIRNLLPKLILSGEMDSAMDGFQVSANLKNRLTTVTAKLDTLSEDPTSLTPAALESIHLELEQVLDDAAHLNLSSHMRLHIDVKQLGFSSMEKAQTHLNSLVVNLKNFRADLHAKRKVVRGIDSQIALLRSEIEGLDANGRPVSTAMQKSLDDLVVERTKKNKELLEVTAEFDQTRSGINTMAGKLIFTEKSYGWKLGSSAADRSDALKFGRNFIDDLGAVTDLQKLQRLMEMRAMAIQRSSSSRRSAFDINSDAEQVKARIEEDYRGLHIGVQQNARMTMKKKKREEEKLLKRKSRDLRDMGLIFDRFHRTDGTGNESLGRVGASIREANYVRLGGGFLLSSIPDLAMGIGQVGLPSYFRALARYMNPFFRNKRLSEDMADWVFASEATLGGDRNRRIAGLDEEDPKRNHFIERGLHATSKGFNNLLMLNKWNGMMKSINSVAIQNKIIKIGNKLRSGKRLSRSDKAFMGGLGLTEDRLQRIAILQEKFGDTESTILGGKFYLSRTRKWGAAGDIDARTALEDRLAFERATFQRVQQTIITPGAGSLPNWMTSTEVGRIIGQFGSFTMSATSQLLIPMLQKGAMMGDMNQALMFVGASTLGAVGYWARQSLDGKDPFEDEVKKDKRGRVTARVPWWKKSILEGVDRGGTLGWLSQGNAYMERMTGVGASTLLGAGQLSRMKSRSKVDMLAGPTAGLLNDFGTVLGAAAAKGFEGKELTEGAYNAGRRLVGWQNLVQTRLALDVAPSIYDAQRGGYGSPTYFDKFIPIQQRLRNTLQEE